jgi:isoprenylcysteine carboxyl methyltransferase (ICMT) family protein YpbQ
MAAERLSSLFLGILTGGSWHDALVRRAQQVRRAYDNAEVDAVKGGSDYGEHERAFLKAHANELRMSAAEQAGVWRSVVGEVLGWFSFLVLLILVMAFLFVVIMTMRAVFNAVDMASEDARAKERVVSVLLLAVATLLVRWVFVKSVPN